MSDWPIGLSTGCFYQIDLYDVLDDIRNAGLPILEICSSQQHLDYHDRAKVSEVAEAMKQKGLEPFSFHAPFGAEIDITSPDKSQCEKSLKEVIGAVNAAGMLGTRYFVLHPGPEIEQKPPADEYLHRLANAAESIDAVAEECSRYQIYLLLENMLPHLLFGEASDLLWIMGGVRERNIGLCLDTGHAHLAGDIRTVVHKFSSHLKMLHADDNRGKHDDHLPPGRGNIDWQQVISDLHHIGFAGTIILELSGYEGGDVNGRLDEALEARGFLRSISRKVQLSRP
jgi:sugar phosphate isomerase/epimerase